MFVFLECIYGTDKLAPSLQFYVEHMKSIKKIMEQKGAITKYVNNIFEVAENDILIIDPCVILYFNNKRKEELYHITQVSHIIINGECYSANTNTFMGWKECGIDLFFDTENILYQIFATATLCTVSNLVTQSFLEKINQHVIWMPVDCYQPEYSITEHTEKTFDVLFFGTLGYPRRQQVLNKIISAGFTTIAIENVFEIESLKYYINYAKIIIHINSIDDCYHIPFAKLVKCLCNNSVVLCEQTKELLEHTEISRFVHMFQLDSDYISQLTNLLSNYSETQQNIQQINPRQWFLDNCDMSNIINDIIVQIAEIQKSSLH